MFVGTASGTVTVGLALFLVLMSQRPDAGTTRPPPAPAAEAAQQQPAPAQAAVRLPPPPPAPPRTMAATASKPPPVTRPPPVARPPLQPRRVAAPVPAVEIVPLAPRQPPTTTAAPASPPSATAAVEVPAAKASEGRALLRMLEAGEGPVIEIAWPPGAGDRQALYAALTRCHGMQTALLRDGGALFGAGGPPGERREVNRDETSGFVRRPAGALTAAERDLIARIERRHGLAGAAPVRLFPRRVDAALLGGLSQVVGADYAGRRLIRARYRLTAAGVGVEDIHADGVARPGRIALPTTGRRGCR